MKTCSKCTIPKALTEFSPSKTNRDGFRGQCKDCRKGYSAEYRKANRDLIISSNKRYRAANRDKTNGHSRTYRKQNPAKNAALTALRFAYKKQRTPRWLTGTHLQEMRQVYKDANYVQRLTGIKMEVDHIIPMNGANVSGLHVPWNLQILTAVENRAKWNTL